MRPSTLQLSASLCEALRSEETEMVEVLLRRGADPNLVLPEGIAAIHLAAGMEQESGVRCLDIMLLFGGDPNVRSVDGLTPLHVAASWGCCTCLKLLLMEGGDPRLEDQDGNRAIDLAMEQRNETCVCILQQFLEESRQEQSSQMYHRRTDSFLSMDTEHSPEVETWLSEDETLESPPKESLVDVGPGSSLKCLVAAVPNEDPGTRIPEDQLSSSLLTKDSQRRDVLYNQCTPCSPLVAPSNAPLSCSNILGSLVQSLPIVWIPSDESVCPTSEVPVAMLGASCFKNTAGEGRSLSPDPSISQDGTSRDPLIGCRSGTWELSPEVLSPAESWEAHKSPPICAIPDGCEADAHERQDADATLDLSQYKSFLDPALVVKITGREGLDVTSPDHAYLFCQLNSTATLDLEKTVVDPTCLARAQEKTEGYSGEERSFSESSDGGGNSQYASCNSECYLNSSDAPGSRKAPKYEEWKAGLVSSLCSSEDGQSNHFLSHVQGPCSGALKCCSANRIGTPSVPTTGGDMASPTRSKGVRRSCNGSPFREAFSRIRAGVGPSDLHSISENECLGNVKAHGLSRMSQDNLLFKASMENRDFCKLPLRELQLTVPEKRNSPGEEDTAPLDALIPVTGKQDATAELPGGSDRAASVEAHAELNEGQGRRPVSGLSWSTQGAVEGGGDSWAQNTVLILKESEDTQPLPVSKSSLTPSDDTVAIPHDSLNIGEEETANLDTELRRRMLATKARHSPWLQHNQRPCHVTPRSKSRATVSADHSSSSSSLFDETLEMPRRPRRVRSPERMPLTAGDVKTRDGGLSSGSPPCLAEEEAHGLEDTELIVVSPRNCQQASCPQTCPSGLTIGSLGALPSSGRKICANCKPSRKVDIKPGIDCCASLEVNPPLMEGVRLPREEETDFTARVGVDSVPSCTKLEKPGGERRSTKRLPHPSRVSFSRRSARGPSGMPGCLSPPPERRSPSPDTCNGDVPLSPGGRPVNLSTGELVEYLYVDEDNGHTLVERHIPSTDHSVANTTSSEDTIIYDWRAYAKNQVAGQLDRLNNPPRALLQVGHLSDEALVRKLRDFGVSPGPVTGLTRKVYEQLMEKLMSDPKSKARKGSAGCSSELSSALETYQIPDSKDDEMTLSRQFDQPDKSRKWREGVLKSSFNYLLLDPRVTQNLPFRSQYVSQAECFRTFISAIFYVGKGKRARPYSHLYEALTHHKESWRKRGAKACPKVQHILEIWASGEGVISMHCFQNVIPVEAYTREASMVDAIGLKMLTNRKRGDYYGVVAGWPMKRRRCLGIYLLHRAMQIFLAEGERQLRPTDICSGQ